MTFLQMRGQKFSLATYDRRLADAARTLGITLADL
jgi:hypothetical protein